MSSDTRVKLTAEEVAALKYAQEHGGRLPDWLETEGANYYRPKHFEPEQFDAYARTLELYNSHLRTEQLGKIKTWVTVLGVLTIIGIILSILF